MDPSEPNLMTPACASRLKAELDEMLYKLRPKLTMTYAWATTFDTPDENAQFAGKVLDEYKSRVRYLKDRLRNAEIIDPVEQGKIAKGKVLFGAVVTYRIGEGKKKKVWIGGVEDHDEDKGTISYTSPLGSALMKKKAGDAFVRKGLNGPVTGKVLKVAYPSC